MWWRGEWGGWKIGKTDTILVLVGVVQIWDSLYGVVLFAFGRLFPLNI